MVASSAGSSAQALGVPHWRIALANIAAGATAGATVEAGILWWLCCILWKFAKFTISLPSQGACCSHETLICNTAWNEQQRGVSWYDECAPAALYPIDTIKTRLQATISGGGVRALLQSGGGKALYAGLWGNLAGVVPASAIFMGIYEPVKQHIARKVPEKRNYLAALGGGALAGLAASIVRVPTEVVKQRLQTGEPWQQ